MNPGTYWKCVKMAWVLVLKCVGYFATFSESQACWVLLSPLSPFSELQVWVLVLWLHVSRLSWKFLNLNCSNFIKLFIKQSHCKDWKRSNPTLLLYYLWDMIFLLFLWYWNCFRNNWSLLFLIRYNYMWYNILLGNSFMMWTYLCMLGSLTCINLYTKYCQEFNSKSIKELKPCNFGNLNYCCGLLGLCVLRLLGFKVKSIFSCALLCTHIIDTYSIMPSVCVCVCVHRSLAHTVIYTFVWFCIDKTK